MKKTFRFLKNNKEIILELLFIFLFLVILSVLLNSPDTLYWVKEFSSRHKFWGIILFLLLISVTQIFAPFSGGPILILMITVYGIELTVFTSYFSSVLSYIVSFFLAKKFGRPLVKKLSGNKYLDLIDQIALKGGLELLIFARTLGFPLADYISYAFGLSNISFIKYILVSILSQIPISLLLYFIYKKIVMMSGSGLISITLFYAVLLVLGIPFVYILRKKIIKEND